MRLDALRRAYEAGEITPSEILMAIGFNIEVAVWIEGGVCQEVRATTPVTVALYDADDMEAEGFTGDDIGEAHEEYMDRFKNACYPGDYKPI